VLSISSLSIGHHAYYAQLAREDYYVKGGEPPGRWFGRGAAALGLRGEVDADSLKHLFAGFTPGGQKLVQNAGKENRQAALDLTFSAEKSVSVLWAFADEETKRAIIDAHHAAVGSAIDYLQNNAAVSRVGKGGADTVRAGLVVAGFRHETSRAQDPNLHTHCLVLNVGVDDQGNTRTLRTRDFFQHKMAAGALYRVQLAYELSERLGLTIEQGAKGFFRIAGIDESLRTAFSTRRQQIEQALEAYGMDDAAAAERAALVTRQIKGHVSRDELHDRWKSHAAEHGFDWRTVRELGNRTHTKQRPHSRRPPALDGGAVFEELERDLATFTERDVVQRLAQHSVNGRTRAAEVVRAAGSSLATDAGAIRIARDDGYGRFATRDRCVVEDSLFAAADKLAKRSTHRTARIRQPEPLSWDQRRALEQLVTDSGDLVTLSGQAGTGKTRLFNAARETWERSGYRVVGATLSGKAARELEHGSGIKSETFEKRRRQIEPTGRERAEHAGRQLWRAFQKKRTYTMDRLKLDKKTVLVIDEAAMADTEHLRFLLNKAADAGAKAVLSGDHRQLPAIEGASPFTALANRHGGAELHMNHRQRHSWMRRVVSAFAEGDAGTGLATLHANNALHRSGSKEAAMDRLIEKWHESHASDPSESLILAGTRKDASELNQRAQVRRRAAGELGSRAITVDGTEFYNGDRVMFTRNHRKMGVANGETGTIRRLTPSRLGRPGTMHVAMDGGGEVEVNTAEYDHLQLGYASTTHKAQGATVDRAFVLLDTRMASREMAYVQVSRPREQIEAFVVDDGSREHELADALRRSTRRETVREVREREEGHALGYSR